MMWPFTFKAIAIGINYQFVTVGDAGNASDTNGYGGVSYTYDIGKFDVTLNQYATFLNAVAHGGGPLRALQPGSDERRQCGGHCAEHQQRELQLCGDREWKPPGHLC